MPKTMSATATSLSPSLTNAIFSTSTSSIVGANRNGIPRYDHLGTFTGACYKCHDIDSSILQDRSFTEHNRHVIGAHASCSTCHDPHGIHGGTSTNNYNLVNFDLAIVGPSTGGLLRFERTGTFTGRCYLRCHSNNHNPRSY